MHMKIRAGERKWVLNRVVERRVPRALMNRPKMGFGVPLTAWMRGPLREWADALVDPTRLAREGFLHPTAVNALWNATLAPNARGNGAEAWNVLMFQAWLEEWSK
jgi:asparagine synthase (glutamine-hydrolysing)